eukprot:Partr_v1_DN27765_c1_g1_i3_m67270 putative GTPase Activating protein
MSLFIPAYFCPCRYEAPLWRSLCFSQELMSAIPPAKDHRINIKIIEAKNLGKGEECDSYCVVRVFNQSSASSPGGAGSMSAADSLPGSRKISATLDRATSLADSKQSRQLTANITLDRKSFKDNESVSDKLSVPSLRRRSSIHPGLVMAEQKKSPVCFKSKTPWFGEEYDFDLTNEFREIHVDVYIKGLLKDRNLGRISIPRFSLELDGRSHEDWMPVRAYQSLDGEEDTKAKAHDFSSVKLTTPHHCSKCHSTIVMATAMKCNGCGAVYETKCSASAPQNCGILGLVRVRYLYTEEYLLSFQSYSALMMSLLEENFYALQVLGRVTDEREETAKNVIIITENANLAVDFIIKVAMSEIKSTPDPHTIFRANSLGSKVIDQYLKMTGMKYLKNTLAAVIKEIFVQSRPCEIDPTRLGEGDDREENFTVLEAYIKWCLDMILNSSKDCPAPLRQIFHALRTAAEEKFPADPVVKYTVVTAFIFLRFFNAAILGPQLFGLSPDGDPANARNSRTLTLLSKTIQQLANMTPFDGLKEPFMAQLNPIVVENIDRMKKYIDELCKPVNESDVTAYNKKKNTGPKGFTKFLATIKGEKKPEKVEVNIERYIGNIHRHLMKHISQMENAALPQEIESVKKVQVILDGMDSDYQKLSQALMDERSRGLLDEASFGEMGRSGLSINGESKSRRSSIYIEMPQQQPNVSG